MTVAVAVLDGGRISTFWSVEDVATAPFAPERVADAGVTVYGAVGTVTLAGHDGIADLVVSGPEVWSYGAAAALVEELELYGSIVGPPQRETPAGVNALSAGVAIAATVAVACYRGPLAAVAAAIAIAIAWFLLDMGLDELGGLLSPAPAPALELRTVASPPPAADTVAPLWTAAPYLVAALWIAIVVLVVAVVVPRVHA